MSPHPVIIRHAAMRIEDEVTMTRAAHATVFLLLVLAAKGGSVDTSTIDGPTPASQGAA
jgi:hypothetical protein